MNGDPSCLPLRISMRKQITRGVKNIMEETRSTRRNFLKQAGIMGAAVTLGGVMEPVLGTTKAFASAGESTQEIINLALTAEQLATTFYWHGRYSNLGVVTNSDNLPYIQAAVLEENYHAYLLANAGAKSLAGSEPKFWFPKNTFSDPNVFLAVLDALETAFIEAYLAAIYQFGLNGRADLAELAGQILGVEAEHRALGRVINTNIKVPNNLLLEKAPPKGSTVANVAQALVPFLSQTSSNPDGPWWLVEEKDIIAAGGGWINAY